MARKKLNKKEEDQQQYCYDYYCHDYDWSGPEDCNTTGWVIGTALTLLFLPFFLMLFLIMTLYFWIRDLFQKDDTKIIMDQEIIDFATKKTKKKR